MGGDIFDILSMGILGDGEDFECTALRIRGSIHLRTSGVMTTADAGVTWQWGIALIGTDTALPDPTLQNVTDVQTDWLALGCIQAPPQLPVAITNGDIASSGCCIDFDVKAKRRVSVGEHIVLSTALVIAPDAVSGMNLTAPISVLWQRSLRRR